MHACSGLDKHLTVQAHVRATTTTTTTQARTGCVALFVVEVEVEVEAGDLHGGWWRGDLLSKAEVERRLRSWCRYECQSVRMALTAAAHHSAGKVAAGETYSGPRAQTTVSAGPRPAAMKEPELLVGWSGALQCPGAGVPSLAMPLLAGVAGEAVDDTALSYLLQQSFSEKKKMEEKKKRREEEVEAALLKRKMRRRKKKLPRGGARLRGAHAKVTGSYCASSPCSSGVCGKQILQALVDMMQLEFQQSLPIDSEVPQFHFFRQSVGQSSDATETGTHSAKLCRIRETPQVHCSGKVVDAPVDVSTKGLWSRQCRKLFGGAMRRSCGQQRQVPAVRDKPCRKPSIFRRCSL